jgi:uncharacterized protein (TIGR03083 family)
VADVGAGQDAEWAQRGLRARAALGETWRSLAEACADLTDAEWALQTPCPGWDVKDQLSHLIGIERAIMGEPAPASDAPLGPHVHNDAAAANEPWVAVRRATPGAQVRDEFVEVTERRLSHLEALTDAQWAAVGWSPVGEVPQAVFLEVRVFDSWVHEQDVRTALERPGGCGNLASSLSLARVDGAMPYVVGKKAGCEEGTVVRFEVTGPVDDSRTLSIAVEGGRARRVADDRAPTAVLRFSGLEFMRLGCGRLTAEEAEKAGVVEMSGDESVARSVLSAMNFMF